MTTTWPAAVAGLRRRLGWSEARLAAALHVTVSTVNRWQRGLHVPNLLTLRAVRDLARQHGVRLGPLAPRPPRRKRLPPPVAEPLPGLEA